LGKKWKGIRRRGRGGGERRRRAKLQLPLRTPLRRGCWVLAWSSSSTPRPRRCSLQLLLPWWLFDCGSFPRCCPTLVALIHCLGQCLDSSKFQKIYKIPRHIKSLYACMEH
jgi:hypothetical protein